MATPPKILALAGSTRADSYNKKMVKIAASGATTAGADVTVLDLRDFPLPIFDEELEAAGFPENALKLKEVFKANQGILIASPEYNSSITPVLKNAIDWISRPQPGEPMLACFSGKVAAIMSASPGALGGLRGLVHIRAILSNINVIVLPDQKAIPKAYEVFNEDGTLKDPKQQQEVEGLGAKLATVVAKLAA